MIYEATLHAELEFIWSDVMKKGGHSEETIKPAESTSISPDDIDIYIVSRDAEASESIWQKFKRIFKKRVLAMARNPNETIHLQAKAYPDGGSYPLEQFTGEHRSALKSGETESAVYMVEKADDISKILKRRLKYTDGKLYSFINKDEVVSTIGKSSKGEQNAQAFILSQEGHLYMDTHSTFSSEVLPVLNHGTLSGGLPVFMSGLIKIVNGKITMLSNDSGHYQPDKLDVYRAIIKLKKEMPGVFADGCAVNLIGKNPENIDDFISSMETEINGKLYYEALEDERSKKRDDYKQLVSLAALRRVIERGRLDKVKQLLTKIEDINYRSEVYNNIYGKTLLQESVLSEKEDIVKLFVDKGADVNAVNTSQSTALHTAAIKGYAEIVGILISEGANVNIVDMEGSTALHDAAFKGHKEIASLLLKAGIDLSLKNEEGKTAADIKPEFFTSEAILIILKEAIVGEDQKAVDNMAKIFSSRLKEDGNKIERKKTALSVVNKLQDGFFDPQHNNENAAPDNKETFRKSIASKLGIKSMYEILKSQSRKKAAARVEENPAATLKKERPDKSRKGR